MWICHCNPFSDKDVKQYLDGKKGESARVSEVYKSCTGGKSPNCGSCIAHLKDVVMAHNRDATVETLRKAVEREQPVAGCCGGAGACACCAACAPEAVPADAVKKTGPVPSSKTGPLPPSKNNVPV